MSSNYEVIYCENLLDLRSEHCDYFILLRLKTMFVKKSISIALNQEFALERSENNAPNEIDDMWDDDDSANRPHLQKMMTLLDKGETDVSTDVEIIKVSQNAKSRN